METKTRPNTEGYINEIKNVLDVKFSTTIKRNGTSKGINLPAEESRKEGIRYGDPVDVTIKPRLLEVQMQMVQDAIRQYPKLEKELSEDILRFIDLAGLYQEIRPKQAKTLKDFLMLKTTNIREQNALGRICEAVNCNKFTKKDLEKIRGE